MGCNVMSKFGETMRKSHQSIHFTGTELAVEGVGKFLRKKYFFYFIFF
jgi:hypothetical protein